MGDGLTFALALVQIEIDLQNCSSDLSLFSQTGRGRQTSNKRVNET